MEGADWRLYRRHVRDWWPRWRPWAGSAGGPSARIHVDGQCDTCSEVGHFLGSLEPLSLEIADARNHPSRDLERITYEPGGGGPDESGVAAFGRALEHVNLALALVGMFLRLPGVRHVGQAVVDGLGYGPHTAARSCEVHPGAGSP